MSQIKQSKKKVHIEEETKKEGKDFPWVLVGLIVKIKDKELENGKFFNKKGIIISVTDEYVALVQTIDSKEMVKIDQKYLETVIPVFFSFFIRNI